VALTVKRAQQWAAAVHHHLEYELLCGRNALLKESMANIPSSDFLKVDYPKLDFEIPYKDLAGGRGRNKSMDMGCLDGRGEHALVVEFKFIAAGLNAPLEIIVDIFKMMGLKPTPNERYLIAFGLNDTVYNMLVNKRIRDPPERFITSGILHWPDSVDDNYIPAIPSSLDSDLPVLAGASTRKWALFTQANSRCPRIPNKWSSELLYHVKQEATTLILWRLKSKGNQKISRDPVGDGWI
jgi:hypothetical protein